MIQKLKKRVFIVWVFLIPIIVLLVYGGARLGLNYSGYCYEKKRYIDDKEKLEIAVTYILEGYPRVVDIYEQRGNKLIFMDRDFPKNPIRYNSITEFLEMNPDCCEVTNYSKGDFEEKGSKISLSSRLYGSISSFVRVRHKVRYYDSDGDVITITEEPYIAITNCGHPWSGI